MHQGTALNPRKDLAIQGFAIFGLGQDESAPGSSQGLVGGGSDKVSHPHGIGVETRADEPGDVGHVHHEIGLYLPGDLGEAGKIQGAGIGAGPGDDQLGTVLLGEFPQGREVHLFGLPVDAVGHRIEQTAGEIHLGPVAQVAAVGQVHTHNGIAILQEGEIDGHIGLAAGMRLNVGVSRAEDLLHPAQGQVLGGVDVFAAAVEAPSRITFGVLVGQNGALGLEHRVADKILRSDHLQFVELALSFPLDDSINRRINAGQVIHLIHHVTAPAGCCSRANCSSSSKRSW